MCNLPNFLKYNSTNDLIRIGRDTDGGYLVSMNDIDEANVLLSFGINDDWSFEKDFLKLNDIRLIAADASIGLDIFYYRFLKSVLFFRGISDIKTNYNIYKTFKKFFLKNNREHLKKFVGYDFEPNFCSLNYFLSFIDKDSKIFFKIDIEGSEYRILDELIECQNQILGLVIEFHDFDLNYKLIESFMENFKLHIIHIHANNCSAISSKNGFPMTLEVTFSRNEGTINSFVLPHKFDKPNNPKKEDINLSFLK